MRIIFCGSREWESLEEIVKVMAALKLEFKEGLVVIEGGARGADRFAGIAADYLEVKSIRFNADWDTHGKSAGALRNRIMLNEGQAKAVVAFSRDLQFSKGTHDMVTYALSKGVPVWVYSDGVDKFHKFLDSIKLSERLF